MSSLSPFGVPLDVPQSFLDLGECGAVVLVGTDRADLHGGPRHNLATVRASMASYSAWVPINLTNTMWTPIYVGLSPWRVTNWLLAQQPQAHAHAA
jgi:hypothetical protein